MVVTTSKQKEIFEKLLVLARGDLQLVQDAIRIHTTTPDKPADLEKVVGYVLQHRAPERDEQARLREAM